MKHQREGIDFLKSRPRAALFDEPGLGKSAQTLLAATEPVLVVAPAMVLDSGTWDDEIAKWAPGLDVAQVAYSSLAERTRTAHGGSRPTPALRPGYRRRWGTVIADESHYLKGRKTSWTRAFKRIRADRLYQATGTPIPNWAHEAFVPLQLAYPEGAIRGGRFGSYWRWAGEWFQVGPTRFAPMAVGDLRSDRSWAQFRRANWGDRMILRLRADCLDLPPLTVQRWDVAMPASQARAYRELKRDFITWLDSGGEVVAWNQAAQFVKLLKAATGLEVLQRQADPVVGSGKLRALQTILADRPRPTLVVAHFRDSVAAAARVAQGLGAEAAVVDGGVSRSQRRSVIRAFQSGALPVLCATLDTISEGMTLTAADQVIRLERSWRPSRNEQVIRRLHRIGQQRPVLVIDLVTTGTLDERVLRMLAAKTDQQMRALGPGELRAAL